MCWPPKGHPEDLCRGSSELTLPRRASLARVADEFALRLYRWALTNAEGELSRGFPLIRRVKNENAFRFLELVDTVPHHERKVLCRALVKRFHPRAVQLCGEALSSEETRFVSLYTKEFLQKDHPLLGTVHVASNTVMKLREMENSGKISFRLNKRRFKRALITYLAPVLGSKYERWGGFREWRYMSSIGRWLVFTHIDIGGRRQVGYHHTITTDNGSFLHKGISILGWLGISSQTTWDFLTESEMDEGAETLAAICSSFLGSSHELLVGLVPDVD